MIPWYQNGDYFKLSLVPLKQCVRNVTVALALPVLAFCTYFKNSLIIHKPIDLSNGQ